jgi:DNA replication protein DnaC
VAEALDRTCRGCGAATKAFSFKLNGVNAAGRAIDREVAVGGELCEECEAKQAKAELARLTDQKLGEYRQWACVPRRYRDLDYSGFTAPEAVEAAQAWARGELRGLCLTGKVGRGKSWLAGAAIQDMIVRRATEDARADFEETHDEAPRRVRPVRWVSISSLMAQLRASFTDDARAEAVKVVSGHGAAVLDDIDKVNPTEFGKEVISSTIETRLAAESPILVTTNLSPNELRDKLGANIASRLAGDCLVVEMKGRDRRKDPGQELRAA